MVLRAVLALDLGTHMGHALRRASGAIESGAMDFSPERHEGDGLRFLRFRAWLHDTKRRIEAAGEEIGLILYERVDFIMPGQVYAAHVWGGNWATVTTWAEHHQIPYRGVPVATIKKAVTGKGNCKKPAMVAAIKARGHNPASHDEADAIALLYTREAA